jgi:hypothetical protein
VLVDGPLRIPPDPGDFHVRLVDESPVTRRVAGEPRGVGQQRREPLHPADDGDVVDLNTTLNQEFLNVAVGEADSQVPADRDDDHLCRDSEPDERSTSAATRTGTEQEMTTSSVQSITLVKPVIDHAFAQGNRAACLSRLGVRFASI